MRLSHFYLSCFKYSLCNSESHQAALIPVRQSGARTDIPKREDEDEDDEPPEGKHAKVKRRLVPIVSIVQKYIFIFPAKKKKAVILRCTTVAICASNKFGCLKSQLLLKQMSICFTRLAINHVIFLIS